MDKDPQERTATMGTQAHPNINGPTNQALVAIRQMKAAGFDRSQFKVETERRRIALEGGRRGTEYGDARIRQNLDHEDWYTWDWEVVEKAEDLARVGLGLRIVFDYDGRPFAHIYTSHDIRGEVWIMDYRHDHNGDFTGVVHYHYKFPVDDSFAWEGVSDR